ncbi:non-hydrolyzing UDP-N-acetylglucosamine 2-epimerase [Citrobacter freundii]|uniref:non-hydrolyzing UDP-N-acetylglucosamine 2-epimerase n=1 Tax=Citrobacter freundii TaxID=546 RepID=UPI00178559C9|nr:UDP-N-acetylglucosamine 2-epimerase (non-hydrolyzing) [Citrobacter freundii]MBD9990822.1 UDP-N-acetylglucosamine 2-epimerase (non-hydrolyzing) [Citrobacter freundii]MBE0055583.1 UDP-N-acetylglucosamine 2-epimerase (non-hydrolyzing) [Citrobacter freundii]
MKKIMCIFGTRPEAIKMAPIIKSLENNNNFECKVCVTAQHREMLDQVLQTFDISADYDLNLMRKDQTLASLSANILNELNKIFLASKPDIVLVHGDTTTSMVATLAAYYNQISVGHVEAGLRTGDIYSPWPEEGNRKITGALANLHFAPTVASQNNLRKENIHCDKIYVTGNTVIDALIYTNNRIKNDHSLKKNMQAQFPFLANDHKMVLITGHRRENFGIGIENICYAIKKMADEFSDVLFVYPVHLNPNIQKPVNKILAGISNVFLIEPQNYLPFVYLMDRSYLILTDSGGIQEEAPSLGKPVLVMRDTTERPEAVEAGTVKLVGTLQKAIMDNVRLLLTNHDVYHTMSYAHNPYGGGDAAARIVDALEKYYSK